MATETFSFKLRKDVAKDVGQYDVKGHPRYPDFTFARVAKTGRLCWIVTQVQVVGGVAPEGEFRTRVAAAQAALDADLAARAASEHERTRDRTVTLALMNALMRYGRGEDRVYVEDIEQVGDDAFRVTFSRLVNDNDSQTIIVNRKGERTE